jgi:D-proline reductase (dithiol) PrdB
MSLTVVKGLQSEIFVPVTPKSIFTPCTKPLKEMTIALATAAGVHRKDDKRFNLAGDFTWRKIPDDTPEDMLMVSHGGYDNSDVNKDINCMFPITRLHELAKEGFIAGTAPTHVGFMGGGGNIEKFTHETGPAIAKLLKSENVDGVLMTAG